MMLVTDLPADVLWTIAKHLQCADLKHLRSVNRALHDIASENVLKNIRVPYYRYRRVNMIYITDADGRSVRQEDPEKVTDSMPVSQRMPSGGAGALSALSRHTRKLVFNLYAGFFTNPDDDIASDIFADMMNIISHLTSLEIFDLGWQFNRHDHGKVQGMLEDMVADTAAAVIRAAGGKLKKLIITPSGHNTYIPKALCSARGLEYFKYIQDEYSYSCKGFGRKFGYYRERESNQHSCQSVCLLLPEPITTILENNSHIKELDIYAGCVGIGNGPEYFLAPNVVDLQSFTFAGMSLRSLPQGHLLPLNPLRNLRHLHIQNTFSEHNLDVLWKSLQAAGTALASLRTKQISSSFITYASTFAGLEELTIDDVENSPACVQAAERFFDVVLPRHGATLKLLKISYAHGVEDVPQWAFEPARWLGAVQRLNVLEELWFFVSKAMLPASPLASRSSASEQLILLQQVLDTLFADLPDGGTDDFSAQPALLPALKKLVICRPVPAFGCGFAAGEHYHWESALFVSGVIPKLRLQANQLEVLKITSIRSGFKPILVAEWEKTKAQEAEEAHRLRESQNTNEEEAQAAEESGGGVRLNNIEGCADYQIDSDIKLPDGPYMLVPCVSTDEVD